MLFSKLTTRSEKYIKGMHVCFSKKEKENTFDDLEHA